MGPPTLAEFTNFLVAYVGISTDILPSNSPVIAFSFTLAMSVVNPVLAQANQLIYNNAVYNLATDFVFNYAQDQPEAPMVEGSDPAAPFFKNSRKVWGINSFVPGVIQSTGDEGTNSSYVVQEAAKNFTLSNLQNLKTPYGRRYLAWAQEFGPTPYGIT